MLRANHAHLTGRIKACDRLAHEALAHRFEGHDETATLTFGVQILFVRREQGRLDELVHSIEDVADRYPEVAGYRYVLAYVYAQLGRGAQTRQQLEALARDEFRDVPHDAHWLVNLSAISEVVFFLNDRPRAQLLYELLLPYANRCVINFALLCQGSASRPLGLLATTLSRYDDAARHFEQALTMNTQIRSALWVAHTQHDYARMLLQRDRGADRSKALELLNEALITAERLSA